MANMNACRSASAWLLGLAASLTTSGAFAATQWDCTYPGWPDKKPVIVKFFVTPSILKENLFMFNGNPVVIDFLILQNNDLGLVGVNSLAEIEPGHTSPSIGASVVSIDKQNGNFLESHGYIEDPNSGFISGECVLGE